MRPDAGKTRVFYGRANDPHRQWAAEMTHGVIAEPSILAGDLLNPRPKTMFSQTLLDKRENIYDSHKKAPLGKSHDQSHGLPDHLDPLRFTFGIPTEKCTRPLENIYYNTDDMQLF